MIFDWGVIFFDLGKKGQQKRDCLDSSRLMFLSVWLKIIKKKTNNNITLWIKQIRIEIWVAQK